MSYIATVFNIMIASPGDVLTERNKVRSVIQDWNNENARQTERILFPIGWEQAYPDSGAAGQSIINQQIVDSADLMVAIFWSKLGSPTESEKSGTVEEILRHIRSGKKAMIYFSKQLLPQDIDYQEFQRVREFKTRCQKDPELKSLYCEYDSPDDFERLFRSHLNTRAYELEREHTKLPDKSQSTEQSETELSDAAREILMKALRDPGERGIRVHNVINNYSAFVGSEKVTSDPKSNRERAMFEETLRELKEKGLIEDFQGTGKFYTLTSKAYSFDS